MHKHALSIWLGLGFIVNTAWAQTDPAFTATYRVTFDASWSATTHPENFPSDPHFSGLIGATHGPAAQLWARDNLATPGIQAMAETGSKFLLQNEINALIDAGMAAQVLSGGGIGDSPGSVSLQFEVTPDMPLVSLVSMIAPSPDWFVGVNALNLRQNGRWQDQLIVDLRAYDAGTDAGDTYTAANQASNPQQNIHPITTSPFADDPILGQFVFELLSTSGHFPLSGYHSGLYFDPENPGDGVSIVISETPDRTFALITWYTYRDGQQMWLAGSAEFTPGDTEVNVPMGRTSGAQFGLAYDGDDVTTVFWGNITVRVPACGVLDIEFNGSERPEESGRFSYTQLAAVGALLCQ